MLTRRNNILHIWYDGYKFIWEIAYIIWKIVTNLTDDVIIKNGKAFFYYINLLTPHNGLSDIKGLTVQRTLNFYLSFNNYCKTLNDFKYVARYLHNVRNNNNVTIIISPLQILNNSPKYMFNSHPTYPL